MDKVAGQRNYRKLFWFLVLLGLTVDLVSKYAVFAWLYVGEPRLVEYPVISGVFKLEANYSGGALIQPEQAFAKLQTISADHMPFVNQGALFGFGQGANSIFAVVSLLASIGIILWSCRSAARAQGYLCVTLGLILAGTLGNFYDRVVFGGVRDFLHWHWGVDWPVFNVADCCLVLGAGLLMLDAFFRKEEAGDSNEVVAAATTTQG
jgi:lipoprotein signal peptidase